MFHSHYTLKTGVRSKATYFDEDFLELSGNLQFKTSFYDQS